MLLRSNLSQETIYSTDFISSRLIWRQLPLVTPNRREKTTLLHETLLNLIHSKFTAVFRRFGALATAGVLPLVSDPTTCTPSSQSGAPP